MLDVPTGFVRATSDEVNPEGLPEAVFFQELEELEKVPCTLYTDRCGANFFVLEQDGEKFVLGLRTD